MKLTTVYDCMGSNLGTFPIPPGDQIAGYLTGSGGVPWSAAQWQNHPTAVRIDQAPINTPANELADVIDMEQDAASIQDLAPWVKAAWANFRAGTRPGQRTPTVYMSQSNVTPVVNILMAAGITDDVNLWLAEPMTPQQATKQLQQASGPFPIVGVQYLFNDAYDVSLVSTDWLDNVSVKPQPSKPMPGTQVGWRFCSKCKALFYGPEQAASRCPVGAQHDGHASHEYMLGFMS